MASVQSQASVSVKLASPEKTVQILFVQITVMEKEFVRKTYANATRDTSE
jgi:hypothetical protein